MAHLEMRRAVSPRALRKIIARPRDIEKASEFPVSTLPLIVARNPTRGAVLYENGKPIIAGGITFVHSHAVAWLVACKSIRPYLRHVLPEIRAQLSCAHAPVVAQITDGIAPSETFARHLGFKHLGPANNSQRTSTYYLARIS